MSVQENIVSPMVSSIFPEKIEEISMTWNNKISSYYSEIKFIKILLQLIGIKIGTDEKNSVILNICLKIASGISAACYVFILSEVLYCGSMRHVSATVVSFNISVLMLSLILWITVFQKRKRFSEMVKILTYSRGIFRVTRKSTSKIPMRILNCYICLLPILASLCSFIMAVRDNSLRFYLRCYLYGGNALSLDLYSRESLLFVFFTIENTVVFLFPNLILVMIVFLFSQFHRTIEEFLQLWKTEIEKSALDCGEDILKIYGTMRKNFDFLHQLTSFPVLIILAQKFLTLFFLLTVVLSTDSKQVSAQITESVFFAVNAIISLFLLISSGSRIHEVHKKIRNMCLETLISSVKRENSFPENYQTNLLFLLRTFIEKEDMTITAGGLLLLTRSLFLQIGAALITYGVIIMQLD